RQRQWSVTTRLVSARGYTCVPRAVILLSFKAPADEASTLALKAFTSLPSQSRNTSTPTRRLVRTDLVVFSYFGITISLAPATALGSTLGSWPKLAMTASAKALVPTEFV